MFGFQNSKTKETKSSLVSKMAHSKLSKSSILHSKIYNNITHIA